MNLAGFSATFCKMTRCPVRNIQRSDIYSPVGGANMNPSVPNSVILTDWSANPDLPGQSKESVLYEMIFLSLLYDHIYVQDEVLALSDTIADWYSSATEFDLVRAMLENGWLTILKHPCVRYVDDDLRELAQTNPIKARAQDRQRNSTK